MDKCCWFLTNTEGATTPTALPKNLSNWHRIGFLIYWNIVAIFCQTDFYCLHIVCLHENYINRAYWPGCVKKACAHDKRVKLLVYKMSQNSARCQGVKSEVINTIGILLIMLILSYLSHAEGYKLVSVRGFCRHVGLKKTGRIYDKLWR